MKTLNRTNRVALLTIAIALFTTSFSNAKTTSVINNIQQKVDPQLVSTYTRGELFGITPSANIKGATYEIVNEYGKIVYSGTITSTKTFSISTFRLGSGISTLYINGVLVRQFVVE